MTDTTRPPAGVFIVRDPDVCAALEVMLEPHRAPTPPASAPAAAPDRGAAILLADAEAHAAGLTGEPTSNRTPTASIEEVLDYVHRDGQALAKQELADARDQHDALTEDLRAAEAALSRANRDVDDTRAQLKDALAKITDLESDVATAGRDKELADGELAKLRKTVADLHDDLAKARKATPAPTAPAAPRTTGSRIADKKAFAALADVMDNQARGAKSADAGAALRLAARAVRKEIAAVYGPVEKKAS